MAIWIVLAAAALLLLGLGAARQLRGRRRQARIGRPLPSTEDASPEILPGSAARQSARAEELEPVGAERAGIDGHDQLIAEEAHSEDAAPGHGGKVAELAPDRDAGQAPDHDAEQTRDGIAEQAPDHYPKQSRDRAAEETPDREVGQAPERDADQAPAPAAGHARDGVAEHAPDGDGIRPASDQEIAYRLADERGEASGAFNLGTYLFQNGDLAGALSAYERAEWRGDPDAAFNLGVVHYASHNLPAAEQAWRRCMDQEHPKAATNLGHLLQQRGDLEGARAAYDAASRWGDPEGARLAAALGMGSPKVD